MNILTKTNSNLILNWTMNIKEKIKYILALVLASLISTVGIVLSILYFDKSISAILICSIIILLCLFFIMILVNRKVKIYNNKTIYYNMFGFKKELRGDIKDISILIRDDKHNKIYMIVSYKNSDFKLKCRIMYNESLASELIRLNLKNDIMLRK